MSGTLVLTLIAVVLSVGEGTVTIGGEGVEWLAPGDRGSVYYELTVGPEARRIDVGSAEVVAVESGQAVLAMGAGLERVQAGYLVELTVPYERARGAPGAAPERPAELEAELAGERARADGAEAELREARQRLDAVEARLAEARRAGASSRAEGEAADAELRRRVEALQQAANEASAERYELTRKLRAVEAEKEDLARRIAAFDSRQQETGAALERTRAELAAARERAAALDETTARLEGRNAELQLEIEALVFVLGKTVAESAE